MINYNKKNRGYWLSRATAILEKALINIYDEGADNQKSVNEAKQILRHYPDADLELENALSIVEKIFQQYNKSLEENDIELEPNIELILSTEINESDNKYLKAFLNEVKFNGLYFKKAYLDNNTKIIEDHPTFAWAHLKRAMICHKQNLLGTFVSDYAEAIKHSPDFITAYLETASGASPLFELIPEEFKEKLKEKIEEVADSLYKLGITSLLEENHSEAIRFFSKSELAPQNPCINYLIAYCHTKLKNYGNPTMYLDKTVKYLDKALNIHPNNPLFLSLLENIKISLGTNHEEILSSLREDLRKDPNNSACKYLIAHCYTKLEKYRKATIRIEDALEVQPNNPLFLSLSKKIYKKTVEKFKKREGKILKHRTQGRPVPHTQSFIHVATVKFYDHLIQHTKLAKSIDQILKDEENYNWNDLDLLEKIFFKDEDYRPVDLQRINRIFFTPENFDEKDLQLIKKTLSIFEKYDKNDPQLLRKNFSAFRNNDIEYLKLLRENIFKFGSGICRTLATTISALARFGNLAMYENRYSAKVNWDWDNDPEALYQIVLPENKTLFFLFHEATSSMLEHYPILGKGVISKEPGAEKKTQNDILTNDFSVYVPEKGVFKVDNESCEKNKNILGIKEKLQKEGTMLILSSTNKKTGIGHSQAMYYNGSKLQRYNPNASKATSKISDTNGKIFRYIKLRKDKSLSNNSTNSNTSDSQPIVQKLPPNTVKCFGDLFLISIDEAEPRKNRIRNRATMDRLLLLISRYGTPEDINRTLQLIIDKLNSSMVINKHAEYLGLHRICDFVLNCLTIPEVTADFSAKHENNDFLIYENIAVLLKNMSKFAERKDPTKLEKISNNLESMAAEYSEEKYKKIVEICKKMDNPIFSNLIGNLSRDIENGGPYQRTIDF